MQQALALAAQARGQVSPNPLVGAIIVRDGVIVGRGYHRFAERDHAEIKALADAGTNANGATLYINLEPCCHYGRTPPCTSALLKSGITRVVAAMADPNPLVAGHGFEILRQAGISVSVGLYQQAAQQLNEKFITYISQQRPFVQLKVAMTLDGKIATHTGESRWITGPDAREQSQRLRAEYDAILIGIGTMLADDPELTVRIANQRHRPLTRIILDSQLRTPPAARMLINASDKSAPPVWICAVESRAINWHGDNFNNQVAALTAAGAELIWLPADQTDPSQISLTSLLTELAKRQITSLIVEGGATVSGAFVAARLIDKATFFIAPKIIGGSDAPSAVGGRGIAELSAALALNNLIVNQIGDDIEISGYPKL